MLIIPKVKKECYACKGRGYQESWSGVVIACITCNGEGSLMEVDEAAARKMLDDVMGEPDAD